MQSIKYSKNYLDFDNSPISRTYIRILIKIPPHTLYNEVTHTNCKLKRGIIVLEPIKNDVIKYEDYPYLVYARVSSDKDSQKDSITNQIDIARYWLEKNGFEWNEKAVFKDEDKSGTLFLERTAMQLILEKARNREIKMVVFKSIHRLARDLKDALEIKEVLLAHGVRVVTIEEDYDSLKEGKNDMKFEMHSMFAAQYPKTLSVSISSALAAKVRRGEHIGKVPYGYRRVNGKLVIFEEEARVIRQIFKWYNEDGLGFKNITHALNDAVRKGEFPGPKSGRVWQVTTVQSIIKNPTFCGTFILNQYTTIKVDGRKKQIKNPREKWKIIENHHPAIVSKEEWIKANSKPVLNKKRKITPWNEFRGLMICGKCGSNMIINQSWKKKKDGTKTSWKYLKCSAYRRAGNSACVNHDPLTYEDFREFIIDRLIEKGKVVELEFEEMLGNQKEKQIKRIEKNIIDMEEKNNRLLDIYLDSLIDKEEFEQRRIELDSKIKELKDKLYLLKQEESSKVAIKDIKQAFNQIKQKDKDLHHAFKVLIDKIVIHPNLEIDITYRFEL